MFRNPKPILVGEHNPYGPDSEFALYPSPRSSAGWRLCHLVLGLSTTRYLAAFDRVNLCAYRWNMKEAREAAGALLVERKAIVVFGRKVATAFDLAKTEPFSAVDVGGSRVVVLPHPSGLCRAWNEPGAFERARKLVTDEGMLPRGRRGR